MQKTATSGMSIGLEGQPVTNHIYIPQHHATDASKYNEISDIQGL